MNLGETVTGAVQDIRLDRIVFGVNPPAGMDLSVIGHWAMIFRKTAEPCEPCIQVTRIEGTALFRVSDGRHRVVGAIVAGRNVIQAEVL